MILPVLSIGVDDVEVVPDMRVHDGGGRNFSIDPGARIGPRQCRVSTRSGSLTPGGGEALVVLTTSATDSMNRTSRSTCARASFSSSDMGSFFMQAVCHPS